MSNPFGYGEPFSVYIRGTAESIALQAAVTGKSHFITDIGGGSDAIGTQLFVDRGTTTLLNLPLCSSSSVGIPFVHKFGTPLRGNSGNAVRVRVGSATTTSWAFIGGYTI